MESFVVLVKQRMKERNTNASKLASKLGMSNPYLYDLIKGRRRWNETTIQKVANELGIEIQYKAS